MLIKCKQCGLGIANGLKGKEAVTPNNEVVTLDGTVCRFCLQAAGYRPVGTVGDMTK